MDGNGGNQQVTPKRPSPVEVFTGAVEAYSENSIASGISGQQK